MKPGERLGAVEHIRGGAALAVAWFHLTNTYGGPVGETGSLGWLGVDCFFVISGFVIPLALHRIGYAVGMFPAFMARRLIRLEPPYLISIALVILLQLVSGLVPGFAGRGPDYAPAQVALHLFYLIPFSGYAWLSPVYWSLGYEFAFYILAALLFPVLWKRHIAVSIVLVCGLSALLQLSAATDLPRVPLFLMGWAAMRFRLGRDSGVAFGLTLASAAGTMASGHGSLSALAGVVTALLIGQAGRSAGGRRPWLGRISYALYLTHVPVGGRVVNLGRRFVEGPLQECLLSLAALAVCLAVAELFHRLAEEPSARLSRRVRLGRDRAASATPGSS